MAAVPTIRPPRPVAGAAGSPVRWTTQPPLPLPRTGRPRSTPRPPSEAELYEMDELQLLREVADARADGRLDDARLAIHMLLYKHDVRMRRRVALRLPDHLAHHADTVSDWVLERVMRSALK